MPAPNDPGKLLRGGEFYSRIETTLRTDEVLLSELRQPCARSVPRHEHELAYFTVVLNGDYLEGDHGHLEELSPFTATFNPSGIAHSTVIGPAGASFFTVELRNQHLRQLDLPLPSGTHIDRCAGSILWPGLRLYSAFTSQTADTLLLESHVLEMLSAISRPAHAKTPPRWLSRVKDRLHDEFRDNLRMRDLASDAGVHPVHLARVFRSVEKQPPGDYLQRLRIHAACNLLRHWDCSLATVAADCGFADQSHFTRVFRKLAGTTPAQFRRALQS
jgi:AraC family transcriptional regulator